MDRWSEIVARRAAYHPSRPAVWFRERWWTYGELEERARAARGELLRLGVGPGDRVGLLSENHLAYLDLMSAAGALGASLVPFNYRLAAAELRTLREYVRPSVYFCQPSLGADLESTIPLADRWPEPPSNLQGSAAKVDDPALLLFTGGTSGVPKAARISHRQLVTNAASTILAWGLRPDDRCIVATPMFHAAMNALTTPLLHLGAQVLIQERFDPGEYLRWVGEHRPTLLFMVPTMYTALAEHPEFSRTDFRSVRWALSGGAPCPDPIRERFSELSVAFKQGYGLTEAGVNCFSIEPEEAARFPQSVGRPVHHLEVRIDVGGADAKLGEVGELWLAGPMVMLGYWEQPSANAEAFEEREGTRWLRTGDLAYRDDEGRYFIVGRSKEMFISGGENVYPAEVERAIDDHPDVIECAVVGIPDERWGEVGLAAVVLRTDAIGPNDLSAFLRERLARYKVPKRWLVLESLPKSGAGKVLKRELPALVES
ncbi:MAG: long-chain fatty acid--CoA ligase [Myxococcota bacterium]